MKSPRLVVPAVHDKMTEVGGLIDQFGSNQDALIQKKKERDHAFNEMIVPLRHQTAGSFVGHDQCGDEGRRYGDCRTSGNRAAGANVDAGGLSPLSSDARSAIRGRRLNKAGDALSAALAPLKQTIKNPNSRTACASSRRPHRNTAPRSRRRQRRSRTSTKSSM